MLYFEPGALESGSYTFSIGTAGATALVLHTVYLPLALRGDKPSEVTITGGTHNTHAPCFHFLATTWAAYLARIGIRVEVEDDAARLLPARRRRDPRRRASSNGMPYLLAQSTYCWDRMTYKQASDNGWQVRRGEKGTQIEYWEVKQASDKTQPSRPNGSGEGTANGNNSDTEKSRLIHRVYTVFNAQQIERIPPHTPKQQTTFEAVQAGEQILQNSGANIAHDQADRAFYSRSQDSIHLPPKDAFKDAAAYYGTALHELAHWTGHPSRLDRSTLTESYRFGDANYAKEELRAELASVFLAAQRGIPHDPEQHASYVNSWIGALKRDKNEIFRAAHDASKATDFILALERDKSIGEEDLASGPVLMSGTSGSSPAAILEQETEELHHDRERVEEKESDTALSAADRIWNRLTTQMSVQLQRASPREYAARYEPGSGTVNVHAKQTATDRRSTVDAPSGDR